MNCQVQNARQRPTLGPARESLGIDLDGRERVMRPPYNVHVGERPLLLDSLVTLKDNLFIRWLLAGRLLQKAIDMPEGRND